MTLNLSKQIKRHVIARQHLLFAATVPGIEDLCSQELKHISDKIQVESLTKGGVLFSGRLEDLYRSNLFSRTAGRILLRLTQFKATNFRQLEKKIAALVWAYYIPWGQVPECNVTTHQSRLYHSQAVAQHIVGAIGTYWQDQGIGTADGRDQALYVRLHQDTVTVSLDSSGVNLYQRGLKTHSAQAPLRENLAAAILQIAGYDPSRPLLDPMCGAGTFSLEAALSAKHIPPGSYRRFAFEQWPAFRSRQWAYIKTTALTGIKNLNQPLIFASDLDGDACRRLTECVRRNRLDDAVTVQCMDFFSLTPPLFGGRTLPPGLLVLNPPYGRRLTPDQNLDTFYHRLGAKLSNDFKGWRVALLAPRADLVRAMPIQGKRLPITHGGLSLTLLVGDI